MALESDVSLDCANVRNEAQRVHMENRSPKPSYRITSDPNP